MAKLAALELNQSRCQCSPLIYELAESVTVFCDFDGPIVDVSDRYYSTYKLGLAEVQAAYQEQDIALPLHILSKDQFWQMKQERTPDLEIALRSGLRGKQIDLFLQRVRYLVNQSSLLHLDQLQPGAKRALLQLHSQGIQLILVTLRRQDQAVQLLRQFGIEHLFARIHGSSDNDAAYLNQAEHKTQLLASAMAEAHLQPRAACSAWMIGDTEADVLAGQAMNIPTIALTCGIRSQTYLQRFKPTHIHANLSAATHYLVKLQQIAAYGCA